MSGMINFEFHTNIQSHVEAMNQVANRTDAAMNQAGSAADRWQTRMDAASDHVASNADKFGASFNAANDEIVAAGAKAEESMKRVDDAVAEIDMRSWSEKVGGQLGAGFSAGYVAAETWLQKLEDAAKAKLVITGIAIATGVAAAALSAVYAAYKVSSFAVGLLTGDSYKSANIDALIKINDEVKVLQGSMGLAAAQASGLNEALKNLGIGQADYISTLDKGRTALQGNSEEMDRLGVQYKDAAGNVLPLVEVQKNAIAVIDKYREGWDRQQAAASLAMGSEKDLKDAVSVTAGAVGTALDRLVDYNLVIGDDTQAAVGRYQESMRLFGRETDLTSLGFRKAIADNIMPMLTDLSDFFRDGMPFLVNVFRYSIATITTLVYGLKESIYIAAESIAASLDSIEMILTGVAVGAAHLLTGDFKGAADAVADGWDKASKRIGEAGKGIVIQTERNIAAVKLAWGSDNFNAAEQIAKHDTAAASGKPWVPKPAADDAKAQHVIVDEDPNKAILNASLKVYESAIQEESRLLASREDMLKTFYGRGEITSENYYDRLATIRAESIDSIKGDYAAELALLDNYLTKYAAGSKEYIEAAARILETKQKLDAAIATSGMSGAKSFLEQDARGAQAGFDRAMGGYINSATNTGKAVEGAFTNAFAGMENALVSFMQSGKINFKGFVDSILSDILRIQVRQNITGPLASMMSSAMGGSSTTGGISSFFSNLFGGGRSTGGPVNSGSFYQVNEAGPELLTTGGTTYLMMGAQSGNVTPVASGLASVGGSSGQSSAPQSVRVELVNQTSQPATAVSATPRFDATGMVVSIILKDLRSNGPIAQAMG